MSRKKILVDLDDVLSATAEGFIKHTNRLWGHQLRTEDYHDAWAELWGVSLEEAMRRARKLEEDDSYIRAYKVIPGALSVLQRLAADHELSILTSRRKLFKPATDEYINRHFPKIFKEIHYAGIFDKEDNILQRLHMTKADLCQALGADYLIDDQLKHCLGAADAGVAALLFGNYKWAQSTDPLPGSVVPVADWQEVEEYFYG